MKRFILIFLSLGFFLMSEKDSDACTGISLPSSDGGNVVARTVEWAATPMQCGYVVSPRKYKQRSYTPDGANGMEFESKYGYVGIYTEYEPFVVEGVNEKGIDVATGKSLVEVDPKYFRPCEVDQLLGDPTKAKTLLGWNPCKTPFPELVRIMVEHDMKFVKKLHLKAQID